MGRTALDLTGKQSGALTALRPVGRTKSNLILWLCRCKCGKQVKRTVSQLQQRKNLSCGCLPQGRGRKLGQFIHDPLGPRYRRIVELRDAGRTLKAIAAEVGWTAESVRQAYVRVRKAMGKPLPHKWRRTPAKYSEGRDEIIMAMREQGKTFREIGQAVGMTHGGTNCVYKRLTQRKGVTP